MQNKRLIYCILLAFLLPSVFFSCRDKYVMSKSKMEEVMYDLQLAEAMFDSRRGEFGTDERKQLLIESVYKKHDITQEILDSSLVWYADRMEQLIRINDSVVARLKRTQSLLDMQYEKEQLLENANKQKKLFASYTYLSSAEPLYSFSLDSVNQAKIDIAEVDTVRWKIVGMSRDGVTVNSSVRFEYADTLVVDSGTNRTEYVAVAPTLSGRTLKNISGYVYVQSRYADFNILVYGIRFQSDTISNRMKSVTAESSAVADKPVALESSIPDTSQQELSDKKSDTLKPARPNILRRTSEMRMQQQRVREK